VRIFAGLFKGCFKRVIKEFKKTLQESIDKGKEPNIPGALKQVSWCSQGHTMLATSLSNISNRGMSVYKKFHGILTVSPCRHVHARMQSARISHSMLSRSSQAFRQTSPMQQGSQISVSLSLFSLSHTLSFSDHVRTCRSTSRAVCSTVWQQETGE
jgi:hypothetical protein